MAAGSSQLTVNQEIREEMDRSSSSTILDLVDCLGIKAEKLLNKKSKEYRRAKMLDYQKLRTPGLKEIRELFKNLLIRKKVTVYNTADILHDLENLLKLIEGLNEIREFFMNSSNKIKIELFMTSGGEAIVKTVLKRISYDLGTDDGQEVSLSAVQLKAKLEKLNRIVSNLKLQLPVKSEWSISDFSIFPIMEASPTVSKINDIIIPAVVARLELAKYSLNSSQADYDQSMGKQVKKLKNDLSYITSFLKNLDNSIYSYKRNILVNFKGNATVFVNALLRCSQFFDNFGITDRKAQAKLRALTKVVLKMKYQLSLSNIEAFDARNWYIEVTRENDFSLQEVLDSSAFRLFQEVYESLELTTKLCLLCFAIIPENEVVMKRFMRHWWVGEGFVGPPVEETADGILQELVNKDCIEPVNDKNSFVVDRRYRMDPSIRWAVIVLAKEAGFFDFDYDGNPTANFERSYSSRACLVNGFSHEEFLKRENKLDLVQTIINVNAVFLPDLFKSEWFSKLKNVKVLYLGRWQTSAMHHIEVESVEFLKGLKSMKLLRFFSLQGISMITKLPDSVCKLLNLRILDLRACHNLELLPDGIGSLKKLTHLDISECYLLDYMPKGIALLSELQVLKGFVISGIIFSSESCTLDDLSKLGNLRKLSIYTNTKNFPTYTEITTVYKFKKLQKLRITWGFPRDNETQGVVVAQPYAAITTSSPLEKLDLECYPCTTAPGWLLPGKFPNLKKLYIRGGNLQNLTPKFPNVEVLRLKFLSDLKMDWKKLRSSFPGLICLEIFKCPKLTYVPCTTGNGVVWL